MRWNFIKEGGEESVPAVWGGTDDVGEVALIHIAVLSRKGGGCTTPLILSAVCRITLSSHIQRKTVAVPHCGLPLWRCSDSYVYDTFSYTECGKTPCPNFVRWCAARTHLRQINLCFGPPTPHHLTKFGHGVFPHSVYLLLSVNYLN